MFFWTVLNKRNYPMSTSDTKVQIFLEQNSDENEYIDFCNPDTVPTYFCEKNCMSAEEICCFFKTAHKHRVVKTITEGEEELKHLFLPESLKNEYKQALK